jgi:predicted RNA binding protein YcfA (HicA-like mRNA interferase family)
LGKTEKLIDKIKANPKHVRFDDLMKVLKARGYDIINIRGSHYSFSNGQTTLTIVRPHSGNKFCHVLDVKEVIKRCLQ